MGMKRISEFLAGLLFGTGLLLSGMTDPCKVIGFLDVTGTWDPSLALVMGGAIAVSFLAFRVAKRRKASFLGAAFRLPISDKVDKPLIIGSLIFGVGWGLVGFCPGPAIVSMAAGQPKALIFGLAMFVGMLVFGIGKRCLGQPRVP